MFTLEADAGAGTVPMILLTSSLNATVCNWSSELMLDGEMTLEMAYYNEIFNVWEPLIEPMEVKNGYRPWELSVHVSATFCAWKFCRSFRLVSFICLLFVVKIGTGLSCLVTGSRQ